MPKIELIEAADYPICPHCERKVDKINVTSKGFFTTHTIYSCYYCNKVISIGNSFNM